MIPKPRQWAIEGAAVDTGSLTVTVGTGAGSTAWTTLAELRPELTPAEGYILRVRPGEVMIAAADAAGARHGRVTLDQLLEGRDELEQLTITDWPTLPRRGVIEGFYGEPWSRDDRLHLMGYCERLKLNNYVYAPKDDPWHRLRWREPYPAEELADLSQLVAEASAHGVEFTYALHPAMSMRYSDDADHALLAAKAEQLWSVGIRSIALLFDDVPPELEHPADIAAFGSHPGAAGAAHGETCARFERDFLRPRGVTAPLIMVPMDYAGGTQSAYRDELARTLPAKALVWWTGHDIVVGTVSREHIDAATASYQREVVLWDNYPVNDFDRTRAFLGPLQGRTGEVEGSALRGLTVNPMVEYRPSTIAIASAADWAWNPGAYDERESAANALRVAAGQQAQAIAPLVAAASSWPPSAPSYPALALLLEEALTGDHSRRAELDLILAGLESLGGVREVATDPLLRQLWSWTEAGAAMGAAARAATALLDGDGTVGPNDTGVVAALLLEAESHYGNVARDTIPPFVREVLRRFAPAEAAGLSGPLVHVVTGAQPAPGELALLDYLREHGCRVHSVEDGERPSLVVVTRGADEAAAIEATRGTAPVLAWGHLRALGLSTADERLLTQENLDIELPAHPLAAGLSGRVRVFRGPGRMLFTEPAEASGALVIARTVSERRPAIVHFPAAAGRSSRITFFFAAEALAPWLVTAEAKQLLRAALDLLFTEYAESSELAETRRQQTGPQE